MTSPKKAGSGAASESKKSTTDPKTHTKQGMDHKDPKGHQEHKDDKDKSKSHSK